MEDCKKELLEELELEEFLNDAALPVFLLGLARTIVTTVYRCIIGF